MTIDSRAFRDALGNFPTGVCVVTTIDREHGAIGMTVNSFSALSLDPPLVLWCIQKDSDRFDAFNQTAGFGVSILGEEQQDLSNRYAGKCNYDLRPNSYRIGRSGQAVLNRCLGSFECSLRQRIDGGDHVILIGEVIEMENQGSGRPLLFYGGEYRQLR
jgi:flavin reductase (DIM6/NTAB) family NADH-FMN oxidoreductase RutF